MATVFNQYYFDVLKKLRTLARDRKYDDKQSRGLLKAIKRHYLSWDKDSAEYRDWFNGAEVAAPWDAYAALENDLNRLEQWVTETPTAVMYKDMPVGMVRAVFADPTAFHYFSTILCILRRSELSADEVKRVIGTLKAIPKESDLILAERITEIQDASVRHLMERAVALHTAQKAAREAAGPSTSAAGAAGASATPDLSGLEDTSLGKLAKEIMAEVDVNQLQKSVGEDGDILKALANPDSGLLKLVGTVSQKMVSKMATGELNQEKLLSDALQFATKMGGSIPGMGNLAGMGDLLSSVMGGAGAGAAPTRNKRGGAGAGGLDMSMLSSLMNMMGGGGAGGSGSGSERPRTARPNMAAANQHLRRKTQARHMRDRLERRKENVSASVEGTESSSSPSAPAADA